MEQESLASVTLADLVIRAAQARRVGRNMDGGDATRITQYADELDAEIRRRRLQ